MKRSILATDEKGEVLFIQPRHAGIELLCLLIDGYSLTFFGKSKKPWMTVAQAIKWQEDESRYNNNDKRTKTLAALRKVQSDFDAGRVVIRG